MPSKSTAIALAARNIDTRLGRVGKPEDVADVIASLLSPDTPWVTGQRIEITGGYRR